MPIYKKTISTTSNEVTFIETLYERLREINGLTLQPDNPGDLFINPEKAYEITLSYKNFSIKIRRGDALQYATSGFNISLIGGGQLRSISWSWDGSSYDDGSASRNLKFTLVDSDNGIELFFANYSEEYLSTEKIIILIPYDGSYLYSGGTHALLSSMYFYKLNNAEPYILARDFYFTLPENGVKIIDHTSLLNSNRDWIADIEGLLNCSIVPNHSLLNINNKRYFSMGGDVIVEI